MKRFFATIFMVVMLVLSLTCGSTGLPYVKEGAKAEESVPRVYANDVTTQQGNSFYVTVNAENFAGVGSFEMFVYYDSEAFSVTGSTATGLLSSELYSIDTSTAGEAEIFVASASGAGISGSGGLWRLTFKANTNARVGKHSMTIAIGEANDVAFQPITIQTQAVQVEVKQKSVTVPTATFSAA